MGGAVGGQRKAILHRIADGIEARAEEIALCECRDTGQAWRFTSKATLRGAENFRCFADLAPGARDGKSLPTPTHINVTSRHPIVPVGVIPLEHAVHAVDLEDRSDTGRRLHRRPQARAFSRLSARLLARSAHEAGLPPGVLHRVNGGGAKGRARC